MIRPELEVEILRLYHVEKWRVNTIAGKLGIHHSTVTRVIHQDRNPRPRKRRPRLVDPFIPFILDTLRRYPTLTARRLYDMVTERGYAGKETQFRAIIAALRPRPPAEAYLKLSTLPGEQAQVDWGHFGRLQIGKASRQLMAFVFVLSYSRAIFLRFFLSQGLSCFLYGHHFAFQWAGGVVRRCLYDNLKSVVLERVGRAIRFNPVFLQFCGHYRYEARPVAVARGNQKGRVERAVRYVRTSFFAARRFTDINDLNRQALEWCNSTALDRRWPEDPRRTVEEVFQEERQRLTALPGDPFPSHERTEVSIGKYPYARFDLNDYSVPHTYTRRTLVVMASLTRVRILDGNTVIAEHQRSYDRGQRIEDRAHVEELVQQKAQAGHHHRTETLAHSVPSSMDLLEAVAERGLPLGRATSELLELLNTFGACALEVAVKEALAAATPHIPAVRHILERTRRESGQPPARPLPLPDDPRVRDIDVTPHDLASYDESQEESDGETTV
jgi:transposase